MCVCLIFVSFQERLQEEEKEVERTPSHYIRVACFPLLRRANAIVAVVKLPEAPIMNNGVQRDIVQRMVSHSYMIQ